MGIIWTIIAIVLVFVFFVVMKNKGINGIPRIIINKGGVSVEEVELKNVTEARSFEVSSINNINIRVVPESVRIEKAIGSKIEVELYGSESFLPEVSLSGDTLEIVQRHKNFTMLDFSKRAVVIKIPEGKVYNELNASSVSGSVKIEGLEAKTIKASSVSGSISTSNVKADTITVESTSGSVKAENLKADKVNCESVSGSIRLSGDFTRFNAKTTSGSIHIEDGVDITEDSSAETTSGSVKLSLSNRTKANITYKTVSGSYSNEITGTSGGKKGSEVMNGGGAELRVSTASGSIRID